MFMVTKPGEISGRVCADETRYFKPKTQSFPDPDQVVSVPESDQIMSTALSQHKDRELNQSCNIKKCRVVSYLCFFADIYNIYSGDMVAGQHRLKDRAASVVFLLCRKHTVTIMCMNVYFYSLLLMLVFGLSCAILHRHSWQYVIFHPPAAGKAIFTITPFVLSSFIFYYSFIDLEKNKNLLAWTLLCGFMKETHTITHRRHKVQEHTLTNTNCVLLKGTDRMHTHTHRQTQRQTHKSSSL